MVSLKKEGKKEALEQLKLVVKVLPNRGHIFQNKLRNMWASILMVSAVFWLKFKRLACRAKDENKIKTYEQKAIYKQRHIIIFQISLVWASSHCRSKMEKQNSKAGES